LEYTERAKPQSVKKLGFELAVCYCSRYGDCYPSEPDLEGLNCPEHVNPKELIRGVACGN
jgi:hypothetical protein